MLEMGAVGPVGFIRDCFPGWYLKNNNKYIYVYIFIMH